MPTSINNNIYQSLPQLKDPPKMGNKIGAVNTTDVPCIPPNECPNLKRIMSTVVAMHRMKLWCWWWTMWMVEHLGWYVGRKQASNSFHDKVWEICVSIKFVLAYNAILIWDDTHIAYTKFFFTQAYIFRTNLTSRVEVNYYYLLGCYNTKMEPSQNS